MNRADDKAVCSIRGLTKLYPMGEVTVEVARGGLEAAGAALEYSAAALGW